MRSAAEGSSYRQTSRPLPWPKRNSISSKLVKQHSTHHGVSGKRDPKRLIYPSQSEGSLASVETIGRSRATVRRKDLGEPQSDIMAQLYASSLPDWWRGCQHRRARGQSRCSLRLIDEPQTKGEPLSPSVGAAISLACASCRLGLDGN